MCESKLAAYPDIVELILGTVSTRDKTSTGAS